MNSLLATVFYFYWAE